MPIMSNGAVSPRAWAIPMMVPVSIPGRARGSTWCITIWFLEAPTPKAASRMEGGTDFRAARLAMMMVGRVINVSTSPPTRGTDLGSPKN